MTFLSLPQITLTWFAFGKERLVKQNRKLMFLKLSHCLSLILPENKVHFQTSQRLDNVKQMSSAFSFPVFTPHSLAYTARRRSSSVY